MSDKELNNQDLKKVTGGLGKLEKYLRTLVGKDKKDILVDSGTGTQLHLDPSVDKDDDSKLVIIKRDKSPEETMQEGNDLYIKQ